MRFDARSTILRLGAGLLLAAAPAARAQVPDKPIRVIVPFTPGGTVDLIGRTVAAKMGENLGRAIVVENRGGASGAIGSVAAVKSHPDGTALLVGSTTTISIRPQIAPSPGYDPAKDLVPVSIAAFVPHVLVVTPSLPVKSVADLVARYKADKIPVSMANGGLGPHFLAGELFRNATGVDITQIAYKGGGEVLKDLVAGHVQFASVELSVSAPLMQRGQIRAIGITALRRDAGWPDLPTVAEQGLPGYEITSWFGFFAPAGTPLEVVSALNAEIAKALHDPVTHERLTRVGLTVVGGSVADSAAFVAKESQKWGRVIRESGPRVKAE